MTDYAVPTFLKEIPDWLKFPELRFINRYDWIPVVFWASGSYFLGEWAWFSSLTGMSGMVTFIWGFIVPTILLYHGTFAVNSLTHLWGRNGLKLEMKVVIIPLLPYSHLEKVGTTTITFSGSAKQGFFKREIDLTYAGLRLLSFFGLVSELRPVPAWVKDKAMDK